MKWDKTKPVQVRQPTMSELETFLKNQLITLSDYVNELRNMGWNENWSAAWAYLMVVRYGDKIITD
jgi:ABC-type uncharacterized transport system YnjBCD substrate-binding protein